MRAGSQPTFALDVPGIGHIECLKIFRVIGGKRVTFLAGGPQGHYAVKLYFATRRSRTHWRRSAAGCRAFIERDQLAPAILFSGYLCEHDVFGIVFEFIEQAQAFGETISQSPSQATREELFRRLIACIAGHHNKGIIQNDLQTANFLVAEAGIYSLDGDQVTLRRAPVSKRNSLKNLAVLLAYSPPRQDPAIADYYQHYCNARGFKYKPNDLDTLRHYVRRRRAKSLAAYIRKMFRTRDPFSCVQTGDLFMVFDRRVCSAELAQSLTRRLRAENQIKKLQATPNGQFTLQVAGRNLSIRFETQHSRKRNASRNRVFRHWQNSLLLHRLQVDTPRPLAVWRIKVERVYISIICTRPAEGVEPPKTPDQKQVIMAQLIDLYRTLNRAGFDLTDFSHNDVLLNKDGGAAVVNPEQLFYLPGKRPGNKAKLETFLAPLEADQAV